MSTKPSMKMTMTQEKHEPERIGFIPARAGSKRLPNKNRKLLTDVSTLVQWTVLQAIWSGRFDRLVVSTDSDQIWGDVWHAVTVLLQTRTQDLDPTVKFLPNRSHNRSLMLEYQTPHVRTTYLQIEWHKREPHLATDEATTLSVIHDYIDQHGPELPAKLVLLQPTSPFRFLPTLDKVFELMKAPGDHVFTAKTLAGVCHIPPGHTFECHPTTGRGQYVVPNGNLYGYFIRDEATSELAMAPSEVLVLTTHNPAENVDIDTGADLATARYYVQEYPAELFLIDPNLT